MFVSPRLVPKPNEPKFRQHPIPTQASLHMRSSEAVIRSAAAQGD
jgi:hypothetical protein